MTSRFATHRTVPSFRHLEVKRAPAAARHAGNARSPTVLVAKVLAGALLVFALLTLVALAAPTIAILAVLACVSGVLAWIKVERDTEPHASGSTLQGRISTCR